MAQFARFEIYGELIDTGDDFLMTQHYRASSAGVTYDESIAAMGDAAADNWSGAGHNFSKLTGIMKSELRLTRIVMREEVLPGGAELPEIWEEALNLPGTNGFLGADVLPLEACIWVSLRTAVATRNSRGGTHFPPSLEPNWLNGIGEWDNGIVQAANIQAAAAVLADSVDDVFGPDKDLTPIIYSRTRRQLGLAPFHFDVTSYSVSPKVRWVRRRSKGRGT